MTNECVGEEVVKVFNLVSFRGDAFGGFVVGYVMCYDSAGSDDGV